MSTSIDYKNYVLFKSGYMKNKTISDLIENNKSYFWYCIRNNRQIFNNSLKNSGLFNYLKDNNLLEPIFSFGKYKNKTYREIRDKNLSYLKWLEETNKKEINILKIKAFADLTEKDLKDITYREEILFNIEYVLSNSDEKIENNYELFYNDLFRSDKIN